MSITLNPYLTFDGTCRDAMEFYRSIFGGKLDVLTFGDAGMEGVPGDGVMHSHLGTDAGFTFMASDGGGQPVTHGTGYSMSISGPAEDADAMRSYFEKLSEGGTVTMPLERQMWGDEFGITLDRFGIQWMVNIGGDQNQA